MLDQRASRYLIQDMPSMNPHLPWPTPDQQTEFIRQLKLMITTHMSFPSIVTWILYKYVIPTPPHPRYLNRGPFSFFFFVLSRIPSEGWGQLGAAEIELTPVIKALDPSRPVNSVSGWRGAPEKSTSTIILCVCKVPCTRSLKIIPILDSLS